MALRFKVSDGVKIAHGSKVLEGGKTYEAEDSFVHGWLNAGIVTLEQKKSEAKSTKKPTGRR